MEEPIKGLHLVRFGTAADQKFLLGKFLSSYDQIIINANILAHMPSAITSLLTVKAKNKPYFIDPQTHAFQHDLSFIQSDKTGRIKKSINKLLQAYGEPLTKAIIEEGRPLTPKDFSQQEVIQGFSERVLGFQKRIISEEANESAAAKYYKFLQKEKGVKILDIFDPSILIAPYFFLENKGFNEWLEVNKRCAVASSGIALDMGIPLGMQVVVNQEVLMDTKKTEKIVEACKATPCDIILVWIDSFVEQEATQEELGCYVSFMKKLSSIKPVVNLYGSFFSVALARCNILKDLVGVSHGLGYGESRSVVPVGGGIPVAKFYFPNIHARLLFREALRAMRAVGGSKTMEGFHDKVCDCILCKKLISDDVESSFGFYGESKTISFKRNGHQVSTEYPLPETKDKTVEHYMWCKRNEYRYKKSANGFIEDLESAGKELRKVLNLSQISHCKEWANAFKELL